LLLSHIRRQKHFHHLRAPPQKAAKFTVGSFKFQLRSRGAFKRYADYSAYDVSYEGVTLTFLLVLIDTAVDCSPRASLNFVEFIWHNIKIFAFIK